MGNFIAPKEMYFGPGSLEQLKSIKGKKAVIVTGGSSMRKTGVIAKVSELLSTNNIVVSNFEGVEPDPSIDTVNRGTKLMLEEEPDIIIGLGGCSAIDAAKAMWVLYEHPDFNIEEAYAPFSIPRLGVKAKFIAIPSTSGTGTEVTCASVITDRKNDVKHPLVSYELVPDLAIVDGEICASMPSHVTAHTGLDALVHNLEAYVSALNNPYSDAMSEKSVEMIFENLPKAFANPEDIKARQAMHDASCMAGYSFSNALLGIVHAMAHQIGGLFGIPHGCANALIAPNAVRYNSKNTERYTKLAKIVNCDSSELFAQAIEKLNKSVEIPSSIKEYGVDEKLFIEKVDFLVENALKDPCMGCNPRVPTSQEIKKIYMACYYGDKIDF